MWKRVHLMRVQCRKECFALLGQCLNYSQIKKNIVPITHVDSGHALNSDSNACQKQSRKKTPSKSCSFSNARVRCIRPLNPILKTGWKKKNMKISKEPHGVSDTPTTTTIRLDTRSTHIFYSKHTKLRANVK